MNFVLENELSGELVEINKNIFLELSQELNRVKSLIDEYLWIHSCKKARPTGCTYRRLAKSIFKSNRLLHKRI